MPIKVYYNGNDALKKAKQEMIKDFADSKSFRVVENFEDRIMQECLSWLRFVEYDENITLIYQY